MKLALFSVVSSGEFAIVTIISKMWDCPTFLFLKSHNVGQWYKKKWDSWQVCTRFWVCVEEHREGKGKRKSKILPKMVDFCHFSLQTGGQVGDRTSKQKENAPSRAATEGSKIYGGLSFDFASSEIM